jgi:hypothetical protein
MKRVVLFTLMVFAISVAASARKFVAEGKTHTAFGNYRIEIADEPVTLMGKEMKAFVISWENASFEVTVAFDKTRKGMKYYVLSDNLSVQYVCNRSYFGVERLEKGLEKEGYNTSDAALNRLEYFHQKVITQGGNCDLDNSKLIAAFYPMLLNNKENIIAER